MQSWHTQSIFNSSLLTPKLNAEEVEDLERDMGAGLSLLRELIFGGGNKDKILIGATR